MPPTTDFRREFFFRRRNGRLNWRQILNVDLERLVSEIDVETLQDNVEQITFADISEDDAVYFSEGNFIQLFRICQLTIEYLLNVQNYLLESEQRKEQQLQKQIELNRALESENRALKQQIADLNAAATSANQRRRRDTPPSGEIHVCIVIFLCYFFLRFVRF